MPVHPKAILSFNFADPGIDYTANALPSATLFFPAGSPITSSAATSSFQCFTVPILDDGLLEGTESFQLSLDGVVGLNFVNPSDILTTATVSIIDNEVGKNT